MMNTVLAAARAGNASGVRHKTRASQQCLATSLPCAVQAGVFFSASSRLTTPCCAIYRRAIAVGSPEWPIRPTPRLVRASLCLVVVRRLYQVLDALPHPVE